MNEEERRQSVAAWQAALPVAGGVAPRPVRKEQTTPAAKLEQARQRAGWGTSAKVALAVAGVAAFAAGAVAIFPRADGGRPIAVSEDSERPKKVVPAPAEPRAPAGDALAKWKEAKRTDTPAAYRAFIARHPGSTLIGLAQAKLAAAEGAQ